VVLHVDADAFFASVEQRQKPSTALAPVVVCGLGPRGVVATASYEARRFGVGSAMPTATARRRCPQGVFLAPRMQAYREHSAAIMAVVAGFADVLEQISIDEAYLVVSAHPGSVTEVLAAVVDAVWQGTGLRVSVATLSPWQRGHPLHRRIRYASRGPRGVAAAFAQHLQLQRQVLGLLRTRGARQFLRARHSARS